MGKGYLKIRIHEDKPSKNRSFIVRNTGGSVLHKLVADESGYTPVISLDTPDWEASYAPEKDDFCFSLVDVEGAYTIRDVPIFDSVTSVLPIPAPPIYSLQEAPAGGVILPSLFGAQLPHEQHHDPALPALAKPASVMPTTICVHLGRPNSDAPDITIRFDDYIKNAASCELYPTWPEAALKANIFCIMSVALYRIRSGWYRRQGYPFDISASVSFDPLYIPGRPVFENISALVEECLPFVPSLFMAYCNGLTPICPGFSQWGSVALAQEGKSAPAILKHYYPDIQLLPAKTRHGDHPAWALAYWWWLRSRVKADLS